MKIKNIINSILISGSIITAPSCRGTIQKVGEDFKSPILQQLDSFVKSPLNMVDTTKYKLFARDTIEVSSVGLKNHRRMARDLAIKAENALSGPKNYQEHFYATSKGPGYTVINTQDLVKAEVIPDLHTNGKEGNFVKYFVPVKFYTVK